MDIKPGKITLHRYFAHVARMLNLYRVEYLWYEPLSVRHLRWVATVLLLAMLGDRSAILHSQEIPRPPGQAVAAAQSAPPLENVRVLLGRALTAIQKAQDDVEDAEPAIREAWAGANPIIDQLVPPDKPGSPDWVTRLETMRDFYEASRVMIKAANFATLQYDRAVDDQVAADQSLDARKPTERAAAAREAAARSQQYEARRVRLHEAVIQIGKAMTKRFPNWLKTSEDSDKVLGQSDNPFPLSGSMIILNGQRAFDDPEWAFRVRASFDKRIQELLKNENIQTVYLLGGTYLDLANSLWALGRTKEALEAYQNLLLLPHLQLLDRHAASAIIESLSDFLWTQGKAGLDPDAIAALRSQKQQSREETEKLIATPSPKRPNPILQNQFLQFND
jgi:hypothetical protein